MIPLEPYVFRAVDLLQRTQKALKEEPLLLADIEAFFKDFNGEPTGIALLGYEVARQSERQGTACLVKVVTDTGGRLTWRYPGRSRKQTADSKQQEKKPSKTAKKAPRKKSTTNREKQAVRTARRAKGKS